MAGALALAATLAPLPVGAQVTAIEAEGNLAVTNRVGCITLDEAKSDFTPADLYPGVTQCLDAGRYEDAFGLFALAGVYGNFDRARVSDASAHQAIAVLQIPVFDGRDEKTGNAFMASAKAIMDKPEARKAFCARIEKIGLPSYYPRYMIQHGMGAFTGQSGDGLVAGFDAKAAFASAMNGYLHCSD